MDNTTRPIVDSLTNFHRETVRSLRPHSPSMHLIKLSYKTVSLLQMPVQSSILQVPFVTSNLLAICTKKMPLQKKGLATAASSFINSIFSTKMGGNS